MRTKYFLGAAAAVGLICASGAELPSQLSPLAGVAFAKAHKHARHYARSTHRTSASKRRLARTERAAIERPQPAAALPPEKPAAENAAEHTAKLQRALETRAQELALARSSETTGSLTQVASAQASDGTSPAATQPRSVSFDFESGLKTTVYPGDRVVREGFDTTAARSLAAAPPSETILARAKP